MGLPNTPRRNWHKPPNHPQTKIDCSYSSLLLEDDCICYFSQDFSTLLSHCLGSLFIARKTFHSFLPLLSTFVDFCRLLLTTHDWPGQKPLGDSTSADAIPKLPTSYCLTQLTRSYVSKILLVRSNNPPSTKLPYKFDPCTQWPMHRHQLPNRPLRNGRGS